MLRFVIRRAYMFVCNRFGHEWDGQDQYTGQAEEDEGEIEVVHTADDCGTVTGIHAAACAIGKLCYHTRQTHQQTNTQPIESTLWRRAILWVTKIFLNLVLKWF